MTSISGASDVFHKTLSYLETWLLGAAIISSIPFHIRYLRNPMDKGQVTSINNSLLAIINGNRESPKLTQPLGVYATTLFSVACCLSSFHFGESGVPRNWEVTEIFLQKCIWVILGCPELMESTNYWWRQQDEQMISSPYNWAPSEWKNMWSSLFLQKMVRNIQVIERWKCKESENLQRRLALFQSSFSKGMVTAQKL